MSKKEIEKQLLNEMNPSCVIIIIIIISIIIKVLLYFSVTVTHFCGCLHWNTHFNFFMFQHHEHHGAAIIHSCVHHKIQIK
jgi:hypothetical protein